MKYLARALTLFAGGALALIAVLAPVAAMAVQATGEIPPIPCRALVSPQLEMLVVGGGSTPERFTNWDTQSTTYIGCYLEGSSSNVSYAYKYIPSEKKAENDEFKQRFLKKTTSTSIGDVLTLMRNQEGPGEYYFGLEENGYLYTVDFTRPYEFDAEGQLTLPEVQQLELDQLAWMRDQVNAQLAITYPPVEEAIVTSPTKPGSIDTPSVLSQLHKFDPVAITPKAAAMVGASSIVFAALLAFPTRLMQAGISKNYSRYVARYRLVSSRIRSKFDRVFNTAGRLPRVAKLGIGLALASVISGFLNPGFGLNAESFRMFGSIFVSNLIETVLVFGLLLLLLKKRGVTATVSLKLGSLLIVLVTVLASRMTGFEPGIVFGLVLSLVVLTPGVHKTSFVVVVEWIVLVALGLSTWFVYSSLPPIVDGVSSPLAILASETLASLTIGALASLPIAMLPFSGLPGKTISDDNWFKWAGVYVASLALFFTVVMPFPGSFAEVTKPFAVWVMLFAAYALVALAFYLFSYYRNKKSDNQELTITTTSSINR